MLDRKSKSALAYVERTTVGGCHLARLDLEQTARLMLDSARTGPSIGRPLFLTSANGEVLARRRLDSKFADLLESADLVSADGQALVFASRVLSPRPLPERVATTDLYPVVARMAEREGVSFYLFGASEEANLAAYKETLRRFPRLDLRGRSHGFLKGEALDRKIDQINALAPDILWLSLGVPIEHEFVQRYAHRLANVKMIKTSGGLLDFVAGAKKRAPRWIQAAGFEWAYRTYLEPRRMFLRYLTSNPIALFLLLIETR